MATCAPGALELPAGRGGHSGNKLGAMAPGPSTPLCVSPGLDSAEAVPPGPRGLPDHRTPGPPDPRLRGLCWQSCSPDTLLLRVVPSRLRPQAVTARHLPPKAGQGLSVADVWVTGS